MEKLDLVKKYKSYYTAKAKPEIVEIPPVDYLSITGKGDPSGPAFAESTEALYSVAYTLKFMFKSLQKDFVVAKLEGQWWFDEQHGTPSISEAPVLIPRSEWHYRLLIRLPEFVTEYYVTKAIAAVVEKKNLARAQDVERYTLTEGKVVQMLHIGPFNKEPETLQQIQTFILEHKFRKGGLHHEIYLSDFRKTAPEKLKTILREPVLD